LIPGYKGYRLRDESRQTDKLFRDYVTKLLTDDHQKLESIKVDLTRTGNLSALNPADTCSKRLTKVRDKLRFSNYGFSALFEKGQRKVDHTRLERIEQFDKELIDQREKISNKIDEIQSALDGGGEVTAGFRELTGEIGAMEQHLSTREQMIRGNV
jgi:hypothetical protein